MTQQPLPLPFARPLPPTLPEPREHEEYSAYLHRCIAIAARCWWERWEARKGGRGA